MARYIRLLGLASLVVTDQPQEISDFITHPALDRDYVDAGPPLNRMILARLRREFKTSGRYVLPLRGRRDSERQESQSSLGQRLDRLAAAKPWSGAAITAMARYVAGQSPFNEAAAALAYAMAYPFQPGAENGENAPFNPAQYLEIFRLYQRLSYARRPFSLRGLFIRMSRGDRRAQQTLRIFVRNDQNGLHALTVTLDNSVVILNNMRDAMLAGSSDGQSAPLLPWLRARTAPEMVLRQVRGDLTLPHLGRRVPANTLVLMRMRHALVSEPPSGFEFAAQHWSYCPAQRYLHSLFESVWEEAGRLRSSGGGARA